MSVLTKRKESLLIRSLIQGNILAFNTLYKEYSPRLYAFAIGYLKSGDEAEELVQEVFTKIWERRAELREELSFRSFLFTIAANIIRKHFRSKAYQREYFRSDLFDDQDLNTAQNVTFDSLYQYLSELVDQLPPRRREIFIKSRFDGMSVKEISEEMKISHKTIENQLSDALKYIRARLKKEYLPLVLVFFQILSLPC